MSEGAIHNTFLDDAISNASSMPKMLEQQIYEFGRSVLSIFSMPATLILRRDFGTQAIHPITGVLSVFVLQLVGLGSMVVSGPGLIDIWLLYLVFMALIALHGRRLLPLFRNMDLEKDGEFDGTPWALFNILPWATQPVIRCLYEPLSLVFIPFAMYQLRLLTGEAGIYLTAIAFCHGLRNVLRYCELWTYVRDMRNSAYRAEMMRLMLGGKLTKAQAEEFVFTAGRAAIPAADLTAKAVDPEFEGLKTPPVSRASDSTIDPDFAALKTPVA